ncbi:hypothetical protein LEMA_P055130.1 [Plenodomus lingam JN3]|uniref:Methyltransferase type 11 domain-containing protein n=1 Tax=Leptosphaeria maculans (strain JN3 / isolate v23.1.3 / race Av1-4-5-6-7-8) TaxID=985895 RepID=E4ZLX7_LEPMJ|nr:hypothetical protein LEMA_P055130.1 [Plenodomus lingam JN3]CBX92807.1 hypothetical protein LEMA_P055130.1 [Plenodomus lingam JN3]
MFAADLTWAEHGTEKVGERRERKERQRTTPASSIKTSNSSKGSTNPERELWWTSGLRKAKGMKPKLSVLRPKTGRSSTSENTERRTSRPQSLVDFGHGDQIIQPGWTCPSTLPPPQSRDESPESEVPELEGDVSSRYTDSTEPQHLYGARSEVKTPMTVRSIDDSYQGYHISPASVIPERSRQDSSATERDSYTDVSHPRVIRYSRGKPQQVRIEGAMSVEALSLDDPTEEIKHEHSVNSSPASKNPCRPLSQWDCLSPRGVPNGLVMRSESVVNQPASTQSNPHEPNQYQRLIRRMESASSKIVLDRLKEDWSTSGQIDDELILEKQLWLLTGFRMQGSGKHRVAPRPQCDTGRVLELYGSVLRDSGTVPLPYPEEYFSHIRASTLPSLVPSVKLPELFRECYKLLAPGGLLELRVMDAAPMRNVAGPLMRMWIEDRLSINLERLFRCSKPCMLVPGWLADAGFDVSAMEGDQSIKLPCAYDSNSSEIDRELSTVVGQSLWKDIWGTFVDDIPDEHKWFWEDEEIVKECLQRRTVFECKTILAYRR